MFPVCWRTEVAGVWNKTISDSHLRLVPKIKCFGNENEGLSERYFTADKIGGLQSKIRGVKFMQLRRFRQQGEESIEVCKTVAQSLRNSGNNKQLLLYHLCTIIIIHFGTFSASGAGNELSCFSRAQKWLL